MISKVNSGMPQGAFLRPLRTVALVALVAGAAGSVGLTLLAGRRNKSQILIALFVIWVVSPFIGLIVANGVSMRCSLATRSTLYSLMLVTTVGSLGFYAGLVWGPPRPKQASVFLIVPLASWLLLATTVSFAAWLSRRRQNRVQQ